MSDFVDSANVLPDILYMKQKVQQILGAILTINPDEWSLQVGGEEPGAIYVQGIQEEDGCLHIELVHERAAGRMLGTQERHFVEISGREPPDEDIPNYWMFLEVDEWDPESTASLLAESLDRVYHAFDPRVTDCTVSVMPLDVATQVMQDDEPVVAVKLPGQEGEWEPVWQEGELESGPFPHASEGGAGEPVRIAYPAPPKGMLLRDAPSMPSPTPLEIVVDDDFGPTNLILTTDVAKWTRRDGKWVPWEIDDESDDPRDRMEGTYQVHVDPPFIDIWDRGAVTLELVELYGYSFSMESTPRGDFYVYTGPSIDYGASAGMSPGSTPPVAPATQQDPVPPAGWYADPWRKARLRWWDGGQWTGHVH